MTTILTALNDSRETYTISGTSTTPTVRNSRLAASISAGVYTLAIAAVPFLLIACA
tara:strand:- start:718 stop:885 length:168 start_codon:yes stop_codon:yes gene_type:complete